MYLTYGKSLPSFDQHMVQLESDVPDNSKVYVGFHEGFVPLAAKYYEAIISAQVKAPEPVKAPAVSDPVAQVSDPDPVEAVVATIEEDVDVPGPDPVLVLPPAPVVVDVEDVAPVVKRTRKTSV